MVAIDPIVRIEVKAAVAKEIQQSPKGCLEVLLEMSAAAAMAGTVQVTGRVKPAGKHHEPLAEGDGELRFHIKKSFRN